MAKPLGPHRGRWGTRRYVSSRPTVVIPMRQYYCYIHKRSNGDVVYVGKGQGNRAWATKRTNPVHSRWLHYSAQYGLPQVEVVDRFMTEEEALKREKELVHQYLKEGCKLFNDIKFTDWRGRYGL